MAKAQARRPSRGSTSELLSETVTAPLTGLSKKRKGRTSGVDDGAARAGELGKLGDLEIGSDAEEEVAAKGVNGSAKAGVKEGDDGADEGSWEGSEEEGEFPELFLSDEEAEVVEDGEEGEASSEEEEDSDEDDPDEEDDLLESGHGVLGSASSSSSLGDPDGLSSLDKFLASSTSKPLEADLSLTHGPDDWRRRAKEDAPGYWERARLRDSKFVEGGKVREWDEIEPGYGSESSTEDAPNRIGNIPEHFYDDLPHIGYDIDGKRVSRPAKGDELDKFLKGVEDPSSWTSVEDKLLQTNVQLTDEELDIIRRLARAENPDADYDPYEPLVEFYTGKGKELDMPLTGKPEPKRRFVPSKWEHKKVMKIVRAIRQGRIVPSKPSAPPNRFYSIWSDSLDASRTPLGGPMHMPAPKLKLPGHDESYNPPEEYLFDDEEKKEWEGAEKEDRKTDFLPAKYGSLRRVPGYGNFLQERFDRLLDLYLAPRMLRRRPKLDISDPSELLPKLPSPRELRPFPTSCALEYPHDSGVRVRCVSVDPTGTWVATGADNGEVRLWECRVGRCAVKWQVAGGDDGPVYGVEWCPDKDRCILAIAVAGRVLLVSPLSILSPSLHNATIDSAHAGFTAASDGASSSAVSEVKWSRASEKARDTGVLLEVALPGTPKQVTWHRRGDYFATLSPEAGNRAVLIHQLSKHQTQAPFKRTKGAVQRIAFHPTKPHFFVATQRYVRVYDLLAQSLIKTLQPGLKWISSLDVHPMGDNVIVGSYDKRLVWHDMDLSDRPYKILKYHAKAIRSVAFSTHYPLFLSTSDDGSIHVFHATVYSDLMMNPLLVPLKVLRGHQVTDNLGVLEAKWHPREPWIVSVGADGVGRLWCP